MTPEADAAPCPGLMPWLGHLSGCGTMPSEGIQGDEWGAYVTLLRATRTNMGSPKGRESYGDGGPVVCAGRRRELAGESPAGPAPSGVRSRRRG
jgi:hypothetical protein